MEQVTLSVADLISLRNILQAAIERGAFKANEVSTVGGLFDRLSAFVDAAQQQIQPESPAVPEETNQAQGEQNA